MPCNDVHPSVRGMGMSSSKVELLMQHCSNSGQMLFMTDRQIHVCLNAQLNSDHPGDSQPL